MQMNCLKKNLIYYLRTLNKKIFLFTLILNSFCILNAQEKWLNSFLTSKQCEYYLYTDKELEIDNIDGTIWIPENVIENAERFSSYKNINSFYTKAFFIVNKTNVLELYMKWTVIGDIELEQKDLASIDLSISKIESIIVLRNSGNYSVNNYYQMTINENKLVVKDLITNSSQAFRLHKTISTIGNDNESLWSEYIRSTYY